MHTEITVTVNLEDIKAEYPDLTDKQAREILPHLVKLVDEAENPLWPFLEEAYAKWQDEQKRT
jgi:hypothetical protein